MNRLLSLSPLALLVAPPATLEERLHATFTDCHLVQPYEAVEGSLWEASSTNYNGRRVRVRVAYGAITEIWADDAQVFRGRLRGDRADAALRWWARWVRGE